MTKLKPRMHTLALIIGAVALMQSAGALTQSLQLSKNADFSTTDGIFLFSDVLYARVTAPQIDHFDLEKNEFHLQPASGGDDLKGAFVNHLDGTYTASVPLSGLDRSNSSWEFRATIEDDDHGRFENRLTITIQNTQGAGDSLEIETRISSVGNNFISLSGRTIYVDEAATITENGIAMPLDALRKDWKVRVLAVLRADNHFWAVTIEVLERDPSGQEVETTGIIYSIDGSKVNIEGTIFVVSNSTEILDDGGDPITLSTLRVGMRVDAKGMREANGEVTAERIRIKESDTEGREIQFTGTITALQVDGAFPETITVNSTVFEVDANTVVLGFSNETISFNDLKVGEYVEIKGRTRSGGLAPKAERIKREDHGDFEVRGFIHSLGDSALTVGQFTFRIVSSTIILHDDHHTIPFALLRTGLFVEVHAEMLPDNSLIARRIEVEDQENDEVEIKGFVEELAGSSIMVSGRMFLVDAATQVVDDNGVRDFGDLSVGMLVEVRASVLLSGELYATRIHIEDFGADEIELRGLITAIAGNSLQVSGINFYVNAQTQIFDRNGLSIGFNQLSAGMVVEIRADLQSGLWVASRIHIEDRIDRIVEFHGAIDALHNDGFTVLGRRVIVINTTVYLNQNNQPISFGALQVGSIVEVDAQVVSDSQLVALRVKLEDRPSDEVELTGSISALSASSLTVNGVVFEVDANTVFLDQQGQSIQIADLSVSMVVEVKAQVQAGGSLLAVRVKIENRRSLSGFVSQVRSNIITIQGLNHVLTEASLIFDAQNQITSIFAVQANQQVDMVAQMNQSQLEVVTLRIVFAGSGSSTGVDDQPGTPQSFALMQNYPNPFNPATHIRFVLPHAGLARLAIYDLLGRRVRTLVDGARSAGEQLVTWDGRDGAGASVASGMYFYRLEANGLSQSRKLTLLR